jgi:hypothetical protein
MTGAVASDGQETKRRSTETKLLPRLAIERHINARPEPHLEAAATEERRLEGVGSRPWFGASLGTEPRLAFLCPRYMSTGQGSHVSLRFFAGF